MTSCGLVQVIHLSWRKSARGGQGNRDRAAVPFALEVADGPLGDPRGYLHVEESYWGEDNAFAAPLEVRRQRVPLQRGYCFRCVTVSSHPGGLSVQYRWDRYHGGAPERRFMNEEGKGDAVVPPEAWMRVSYNGRFSDADTGRWWYEQTTVNVAGFGGEPSARVFVDSEPARELRLLVGLW